MNRTFWGWVLQGLNGCLNIMEKLVVDNAPLTAHFKGELLKAHTKFTELVNIAVRNVEDE